MYIVVTVFFHFFEEKKAEIIWCEPWDPACLWYSNHGINVYYLNTCTWCTTRNSKKGSPITWWTCWHHNRQAEHAEWTQRDPTATWQHPEICSGYTGIWSSRFHCTSSTVHYNMIYCTRHTQCVWDRISFILGRYNQMDITWLLSG